MLIVHTSTESTYQRLVESGENITQPDHPGPPPSGWKLVNESTYKDLVPSIPLDNNTSIYYYITGIIWLAIVDETVIKEPSIFTMLLVD